MKVLIVSDTHYRVDAFISELDKHKDAELIIHLGDMVDDAIYIKNHTDIPVEMVRGNNDYNAIYVPYHNLIRLKGHRILLTHGHLEKVYFGNTHLIYKAKECEADIVMYGHTHIFNNEVIDGITIINPGSAGYDRGGEYESYVVMNIDEENVEFERVEL